ncbi:MAG: tetratricopeptide repeat protein [Candidatus Aminicenantes bacterium]|nr:tetratricopeptide repeat protein [Candidatus Aminicenantes bacterium]
MASEKERNKIIAQAEKYIKKGKILDAIGVYEKLITSDEQDISIRNTIGDLYLKANKKNKAIEQYKSIAEHCEEQGLSSKAIAIFKKISKLDPDDIQVSKRLADLYSSQGFLSEAKAEYIKTAKNLANSNRRKEAIPLFEKVLALSPTDIGARLTLAELYSKQNMVEKAVEMLNQVAELKLKKNEVKDAEEILNLARDLKGDDARTLRNLIHLYKSEKRTNEAYRVVNEILKDNKENVSILSLLGNLYYEDGEYDKSEEIFLKVYNLKPNDVQARSILGYIQIHKGELDRAYEYFEPIVASLIKKKRLDKAIGILGLIISSKEPHIPTLEKLAGVFKKQEDIEGQETAYKIILNEYRNMEQYNEAIEVVNVLSSLRMGDESYHREYERMKAELSSKASKVPSKEVKKKPEKVEVHVDNEDTIKAELSKVDIYLEQKLNRNALKLLDDLRNEYPKNPLVKAKITEVMELFEKSLPEEGEKASEKEAIPEAAVPDAPVPEPAVSESPVPEAEVQEKEPPSRGKKIPEAALVEGEDEKITAAEIFADTDILPYDYQTKKQNYYDLKIPLEEEQDSIRNAILQQLKGSMTPGEKDLSEIVTHFKEGIKEKVDEADHESRYNLGIAFMEQGLYEEAVEELKLASKDPDRTLECYIIISFCYRQKKEVENALKWMKKAMDISAPGDTQIYDLKFEMASIYEELGVVRKAMDLYQEVKEWDSRYRGVSKRIAKLKDSRQA